MDLFSELPIFRTKVVRSIYTSALAELTFNRGDLIQHSTATPVRKMHTTRAFRDLSACMRQQINCMAFRPIAFEASSWRVGQ